MTVDSQQLDKPTNKQTDNAATVDVDDERNCDQHRNIQTNERTNERRNVGDTVKLRVQAIPTRERGRCC